jgi:endonuclease/exonuclease/phosphatase family metal-dependent hydrolase
MTGFTLVTWNVEWRAATSTAADIIRARIFACQPDIICLTEAPADFLGDTGHVIEADADHGYPIRGNRRKVLLWSRQPWTAPDSVGHPDLPGGRYVSGATNTPAGSCHVTGVCIPWSAAHVTTGRRDRTRWEDHLRYLSGLQAILKHRTGTHVVVGDFNQAIPRRTAPLEVHAALRAAIMSCLTVATAGLADGNDAAAIDHVAHSSDLGAEDVRALSRIGPHGESLSDHFGIAARLRSTRSEVA